MPLTHSGTILVCGLEQIGCTIATGLCKSGDVKKIYLYDKETVTNEDVETMTEYYAGNDVDIKTRGEAMTNYLINRFDVEVETSFFTGSAGVPEGALSLVDIVIFTTCNRTNLIRYNEYCRAQRPPICFINACNVGLAGYTFIDRGIKFKDKSFRYSLLNKNSYQSLDLQRRVITDGVEIHSMINGIAAFQEQNGYLPEYGNKSHPKLVLKRGGEFTHLNANDLERCSTALDEFKESKDEDDLKLADVMASSTSLSFSPLINMVSGVTLGYIGQYIRAGAMVHGEDTYLDKLCGKSPAIEKPLFYFDATSIPLKRFDLGLDKKYIYTPLIRKGTIIFNNSGGDGNGDEDGGFTKQNFLLFTDGTYLPEAVAAITHVGIASGKDSKLTILSTKKISEIKKKQINKSKAKITNGEIVYANNNHEVEYDRLCGAMIFCPQGNSEQLELFVNDCMNSKNRIRFLTCVIAPETVQNPYKFITTPSIPDTTGLEDNSNDGGDDDDSDDEATGLSDKQINSVPYLWISSMKDNEKIASTDEEATEEEEEEEEEEEDDEITIKAYHLFLDRFIGVKDIVVTMAGNNTNLGWNMVNERKFETTKRYHEVVSSIAVLIGFVARTYSGNSGMSSSQSRAGTNFILDKAYQMFQTSFPFLMKEKHLQDDESFVEKRKRFVTVVCKLYLNILKQHNFFEKEVEKVINEYEEALETNSNDKIAKFDFNKVTLNGAMGNSETTKDGNAVAPKYLFDAFKSLNESIYGQKRFKLFLKDLNPSSIVKEWCEEFITITMKLYRLEEKSKRPSYSDLLKEDKEWISKNVISTLKFTHRIMDASRCQIACGILATEAIKNLSNVTVKNDDSDDKIYEVQFETYDEANSFKKTNAFVLECADFKDKDGKTVKYQKEKKIEEEDDDQNFGSDDGGSDEESSDRGENDDESEARDEDDADDTSEI